MEDISIATFFFSLDKVVPGAIVAGDQICRLVYTLGGLTIGKLHR